MCSRTARVRAVRRPGPTSCRARNASSNWAERAANPPRPSRVRPTRPTSWNAAAASRPTRSYAVPWVRAQASASRNVRKECTAKCGGSSRRISVSAAPARGCPSNSASAGRPSSGCHAWGNDSGATKGESAPSAPEPGTSGSSGPAAMTQPPCPATRRRVRLICLYARVALRPPFHNDPYVSARWRATGGARERQSAPGVRSPRAFDRRLRDIRMDGPYLLHGVNSFARSRDRCGIRWTQD